MDRAVDGGWQLVEMAGEINLFGETGKHFPWMTWDALAAADPDVVLILPCGFDIARSWAEMAFLTQIGGVGRFEGRPRGASLCDRRQPVF